jgi:N-acetylmuramoyl-L-alanine amidase
MKKMKSLIIFLLLIIFSVSLSAGAVGSFARGRIFYDNQDMLFIVHPNENSRTTTSSRMSFLGDSDSRYRLFINGEIVPTTENGFFAYYAELELGENQFLIVNGTHSDMIVITREEAVPWDMPETTYFTDELWASVEGDFIPRFAYFDDDLHGKTPLMPGTTFRLLGERGDFYIIGDGTMMFKNHVFQLGREVRAVVSGGEISSQGNSVSVSFDVTDNPLYEVVFSGSTAFLTLYAYRDISELSSVAAPYVIDINKRVQFSPGAIVYEIEFARVPTGYMVEFSHNQMNIDFKFAPTCLTEAFVLLDAGHGGGDPGALGPAGEFGSMEKDFNLFVAETARDYLRALGIQVLLIRDTDDFVQIMDRVEYFRLEPDIAVSVHANSAPLTSDFSGLTGPLMFYTLDTSEQAAFDMITLIDAEVSGFTTSAPEPLHRRQNFAMARYTGGPAMLFEMGFMCNPIEYELMLNSGYLTRLGTALGMSIEQYLKNLIIAENPEAALTFAPLPPPPVVYDIEDTYPALVEAYSSGGLEDALSKYMILIACILLGGALLLLPSAFKRR